MNKFLVEIDDITIFSFYAVILGVSSGEQENRVSKWVSKWASKWLRGVNNEEREVAIASPAWDELPEWMNVVTRDANGMWYGYTEMPVLFPEKGCWLSGGLRCLYVSNRNAPKLDGTPWYSSIYVRDEHEQ